MKRSEALAEIKQCGYHGKMDEAVLIQARKNIGAAAARKAYLDGKKAKDRGEACDCPICVKARSEANK